jgi:sRNA-binding protein
MVYHGKNHRQAMGAVTSHLGARILRVLKEDRPYEIRDLEGKPINKSEAKGLILSQYHVSEEVRRERRRRNTKTNRKREAAIVSIHEAAEAPQTVQVMSASQK